MQNRGPYNARNLSGNEPHNTMTVVARRTGLSPHVLRVWERRYGAVSPGRSESNRRLYTDEDVERLKLLRLATVAGYPIGRIAQLPVHELAELARHATPFVGSLPGKAISVDEHFQRCRELVARGVPGELERGLEAAHRDLGLNTALEDMVTPLLRWIGNSWHDGTLRVAQEHVASEDVRRFLGGILSGMTSTVGMPVFVSTTLPGARHGLGALMAALTAGSEGWRALYLGDDLPLEETAHAAAEAGARVVAISAVHVVDAALLEQQLRTLYGHVSGHARLVVGGAGAAPLADTIRKLGGSYVADLAGLRALLDEAW